MSRTTLAILAVASVGLAFIGCSGDNSQVGSDVVSAITALDNAGLHDIDESINERQEAPADARTTALHMEAVTRLAEWPKEFRAAAEQLAVTLSELAAVLDSDEPDLAKAGELAKRAHDAQHDLSREVWAWLQAEAGIEAAADGSD